VSFGTTVKVQICWRWYWYGRLSWVGFPGRVPCY